MFAARVAMIVVLVGGLGFLVASGVGQDKTRKTPPKSPAGADAARQSKAAIRGAGETAIDAEIRASADRFSDAYNRHDAKAVAACFASGAEFVTETGMMFRGREALERHFTRVFADAPQVHLELKIDSVRKLATGAAIEEGAVTLTRMPGEPPMASRYMAVHVLEDSRWVVALARDEAARDPSSKLVELDWLVGDWMDESEGALILTNCRRAAAGDHLMQEFTIRRPGEPASTGTTRIAWDPQSGQIKSWTFDSRGGRSEALWSRARGENTWILKSQGVNSSGQNFSATAVLRKVDDDTLTWESRDRVEGGVPSPNWGPVMVKRQPPAPGE
jgi:uncharacterized protein (TIGR02246 family)